MSIYLIIITINIIIIIFITIIIITFRGMLYDVQSSSSPTHEEDREEGALTEVRSDIPTLFTAAQEIRPTSTLSRIPSGEAAPPRLTQSGQDMRSAMLKPSSASQTRSHRVSVPSSAGQIPSIQVKDRGKDGRRRRRTRTERERERERERE